MYNSNESKNIKQNAKDDNENFDWKIYTKLKENCKYLDLGRHSIYYFPEKCLDKLKDIQYLYLEGNELQELSPAFFPTLIHLKWIDLRNNKLKNIPKTIMDHPSLQVLLLEGNDLQTIPIEVGSLKFLRGLQLARNPITFPPKNVINEGVQSILKFLRKQWQQLQSPQQIQLISETHSQTKEVSSKTKSVIGRKSKAGVCKSAVMLRTNNKDHHKPRKIQSGLCTANLSKCISVQPISQHRKQISSSVTKWVVDNEDKEEFSLPYNERKTKHSSKNKISLCSDELKSNTDSELHSKFLRDIWIEKVRKMLLKQEAILQRRRNAEALQQWQQEAKMMQDTPNKTKITADMTFPYDTDPEYLKMLSRKDLREIGSHKRGNSSLQDLKKEEPINDKILSILAALQNLQMGPQPASLSPRSEQRILAQEIKKIKAIQRSLNALKLKNFGHTGLT